MALEIFPTAPSTEDFVVNYHQMVKHHKREHTAPRLDSENQMNLANYHELSLQSRDYFFPLYMYMHSNKAKPTSLLNVETIFGVIYV